MPTSDFPIRDRNRPMARRDAVAERAALRATRTDEQQIARLDSILGDGQGAVKERARLASRIANRKAAKPAKAAGSQLAKLIYDNAGADEGM